MDDLQIAAVLAMSQLADETDLGAIGGSELVEDTLWPAIEAIGEIAGVDVIEGESYLETVVNAASSPREIPGDYHTRVYETYCGAILNLRDEGLHCQLEDTGGSCKAIEVTGYKARRFKGAYLLITAGGPLTDERDPTCAWEIGVYERGECNEHLAFNDTGIMDIPSNDIHLARLVRNLARVLR